MAEPISAPVTASIAPTAASAGSSTGAVLTTINSGGSWASASARSYSSWQRGQRTRAPLGALAGTVTFSLHLGQETIVITSLQAAVCGMLPVGATPKML